MGGCLSKSVCRCTDRSTVVDLELYRVQRTVEIESSTHSSECESMNEGQRGGRERAHKRGNFDVEGFSTDDERQ